MRIALFGLGFMGSTHLKALKRIPGAELVSVVSNDPKALTGDLSAVQGNIGGPGEVVDFSNVRKYMDPYEALRDRDVEAVDICLPTGMHAPVAIAALRAGKHVFVEKPMALDGQEADEMIAVAEASGRILMVAQVVRFVTSYRVMREAIKSGRYGPVRSALFRRRCAAPGWGKWISEKSQSGGGVFDLLIHDVDFCLHLLGKPEAVSAVGYEDMPRGIDWISAELHFPDVGGVVITGGWHHPKAYPFSMEYTVVADGGTFEYAFPGKPPTLYRADGEEQKLDCPDSDWYEEEIRYFLDCVKSGKKPEFCPPEESAAAVKLANLMVEARDKKGEKIACRL